MGLVGRGVGCFWGWRLEVGGFEGGGRKGEGKGKGKEKGGEERREKVVREEGEGQKEGKGAFTGTEGYKPCPILDEFGGRVPSLRDEFVGTGKASLCYSSVSASSKGHNAMKDEKRTMSKLCQARDVHLPRLYAGTRTVTPPGIYVPSISSPSGGVSLSPPEGIGGCRRRVSLMTPFRWGIEVSSLLSEKLVKASSSVRSLAISVGAAARW